MKRYNENKLIVVHLMNYSLTIPIAYKETLMQWERKKKENIFKFCTEDGKRILA